MRVEAFAEKVLSRPLRPHQIGTASSEESVTTEAFHIDRVAVDHPHYPRT